MQREMGQPCRLLTLLRLAKPNEIAILKASISRIECLYIVEEKRNATMEEIRKPDPV